MLWEDLSQQESKHQASGSQSTLILSCPPRSGNLFCLYPEYTLRGEVFCSGTIMVHGWSREELEHYDAFYDNKCWPYMRLKHANVPVLLSSSPRQFNKLVKFYSTLTSINQTRNLMSETTIIIVRWVQFFFHLRNRIFTSCFGSTRRWLKNILLKLWQVYIIQRIKLSLAKRPILYVKTLQINGL